MENQNGITFEQFQASGYDSHAAEESRKDSSAYHNAESMSWDGAIRVYMDGGLILCKMADGTYFFDDYKERFTGSFEEMERALFKFAKQEGL